MKILFNRYLSAYRGLPSMAWLLALVVLVNRSGTMVLFFMALYVTSQLDFSAAAAGQLISIYGLGAMAGSFLGGWLTDRIGAVRVQLYSLLLTGIGFIALSLPTDFMTIALLLFFIAVVAEAFRPANGTAMAMACPPELRARGFGLNRLAINIGITIGPAVGGFLARYDYHYLFWVDGITCLTAALLIIMLWKSFRHLHQTAPSESRREAASPWKDHVYLLLLGLILVMGLVFVQLFNTWPLHMRSVYLLTEDRIGLLLGLNAILVTLVEMPLIHALENKHTMKVIATGCLFLFTGFAVLPLGSGFLFAAFSVIIWSVGEMLVFPQFAGFVANRAGDANRGSYMGLFTLTFSLSLVIGPASGTFIYESFGVHTLWYGIGVTGILVWISMRILIRRAGL